LYQSESARIVLGMSKDYVQRTAPGMKAIWISQN